jgi:pseudouridine-5'-phosphate glycosidase
MNPLRIAPRVVRALDAGQPVVALETTLVTHGLPAPEGVNTAKALEADVRESGAEPATIGVLGGAVVIGLAATELEALAAPGAIKLNLSNLAAALAAGQRGSTTVAATAWCASRAGIRVFATGGIGGVHRGFAEHGDASADLEALARFPVVVVSAGAKAVLDLPRTREVLETLGVPLYGFGTDAWPAFYRRDSGLRVDARFDEPGNLAAAAAVHFELGGGGVLVGNPIPAEHELPADVEREAIAAALAQAAAAGVAGRDVTPFLLERLRHVTAGRSVTANVALLRNNARLAGRIAAALPPTRPE